MQSPLLHLAILWHQHQPYYGDCTHTGPGGCFPVPWVRLHALRDYYSMAALVAAYPEVHLTINLTPVLLRQLADYAERDWTDSALELTRTPTARLTAASRGRRCWRKSWRSMSRSGCAGSSTAPDSAR